MIDKSAPIDDNTSIKGGTSPQSISHTDGLPSCVRIYVLDVKTELTI
jgi:hypothetical protein